MKSFTERNPKIIGLIGVSIMAVIAAAAIFLNHSLFSSGYPISAQFSSAAGISKGTDVLLAGVNVGSVSSVNVVGNHVVADLTINGGTVLPHDTEADVQVETLLGLVEVTLKPLSGWSHPLVAGAMITNTSVPDELYQIQNTAGKLLAATNAKALNSVVESLAAITQGKQKQVAEIIQGLAALTTTINDRSGEVSQLIDSANVVSGVLADKDQQLSSLITNLNTVTGGLADNSVNLADLIDNVDQMASQTNGLISQNQPQLNATLANLHTILGIVSQHQVDLAEGVSYLGAALQGFASVGYSGPNDTPNTWANIYADPATITSTYGVIGPCGALDQVLNEVLGPDPLGCDDQTGPLPGAGSTGTTGGPKDATKASASQLSAEGFSPSGASALAELLDPLFGAGK
jgi:phospholipid/cholesterol/gamma-HCH transport system substrate-binding protein